MAATRDIIIIGGGHNGLVTAAYLAKAGMKPLVLESRLALGGAARTEELAPGFRCPTLAHAGGPFEPKVIADLGLAKHGVEWITPAVRAFAPDANGGGFCLYDDAERTATELSKLSAKDAAGYREFRRAFERIGKVLGPILRTTPPSIDRPTAGDALTFLKVGKNFRGLGKRDAYRLLRWGPMAVADLVSEFFESDLLRATIAARGIYGSFAGPWSAGTALPLLLQAALDGQALAPAQTDARVKTEVQQPGAKAINIDYYLERAEGGWRVYDIEVGGVSLVTNYRDSFATEIRNTGIPGLIESLKEKNRQGTGSAAKP